MLEWGRLLRTYTDQVTSCVLSPYLANEESPLSVKPQYRGGGGDGKHMLQNLAQMNSDKYLTIEEKSWTPKETYRST